MRKSQYADLLESDDRQNQGSESSEYQVESINQRGCQSASADAKRYHKIPLKTQILLFQMVFVNGKRIKQVAKSLGINYSSAKSLIHYYKNNKRPIPSAISSILNQAKPCGIKRLSMAIKICLLSFRFKRTPLNNTIFINYSNNNKTLENIQRINT